MAEAGLFIGLMSGTSTDGVDAVLADFSTTPARILAQASLPMPSGLRREFLALNEAGDNELARAALAGNELARLYARACASLLADAGVPAARIAAIGAHGQTVRHDPARGYTLQLNAPALLAELTGIAVIADFRSRDVAAGGQGAPLAPGFHAAVFSAPHPRAVLNLGGIANLTLLRPGRPVAGFDTGPANMLLDLWCQAHTGAAYDEQGRWAASGRPLRGLLELFLEEPWFALPPPKSTGRDLFNAQWLREKLARFTERVQGGAPAAEPLQCPPQARDGDGTPLTRSVAAAPQDVQASLQSLTVRTVADALQAWAPETREVLVCGGGAHNSGLMAQLAATLGCPVRATAELGIPAQTVEALAFAWLAWAHERGVPASIATVTGARGPRVLGCRYPA